MKKLLFIILVVFMSSCTPIDKRLNYDNLEADLKEIRESGEISEKEDQLLLKKIRYLKNNQISKSMTYKEILKQAKLEEIEENKANELRKVVDVSLLNKTFSEERYGDDGEYGKSFVNYFLAVNNKSTENIRAFRGVLLINDLLDKELKRLEVNVYNEINSSSEVNIRLQKEYNQEKDVNIKETEFNKIKAKWMPQEIIYSDKVSMQKGDIDALKVTIQNTYYGGFFNTQIANSRFTWELQFKNESEKTISAFKGTLVIKDLFDNEIENISFNILEDVLPGKFLKKEIDGISRIPKDGIKLSEIGVNNFKTEIEIEKLVFSDGTELELEKQIF